MNSQPESNLGASGKKTQVTSDVQNCELANLDNLDDCSAECLLTKKELAHRLKKSVRSIENWMKLHYLPYIKIGHSVLFRWRDVTKALDRFQMR